MWVWFGLFLWLVVWVWYKMQRAPDGVDNVAVCVREVLKKNAYKAVRLTAWVDPPSPEAVRNM